MSRVDSYWNPEHAEVEIHWQRDIRLASQALVEASTDERGSEAEDFLARRFPQLLTEGTLDRDTEFVFRRDETHIVIDALVQYAKGLNNRPLLKMRTSSLIGELVMQPFTRVANL